MEEITNQEFKKQDFIKIIKTGNKVFNTVIFDNCDINLKNEIKNIPHIKDVNFIDSIFLFCAFGPCVFENVTLLNQRFIDYGRFCSPFFNKVIIEGKTSSFRINTIVFLGDKYPEIQKKADIFREEYYKKIEWALDISKAKLSSFDYDGIPGHLFIRDPDTQFLIKREKFNSLELLDDKFKERFSYIMMYLEDFVYGDSDDIVITTPLAKPKKYTQPILEGLQELRRLGFAEKD